MALAKPAGSCTRALRALAGAGPHEAWVTQIAAWAALVAGAALGAVLDARMGGDALAVPAAAAGVAMVVAVGRRLA